MKTLATLMTCLISLTGFAQKNKKSEDVAAIKSMCGCYEITFNYAETFAPDKDYEFHDRYRAGALEYVIPLEEGKDKIILQHLLVINDSMIIKHWRQDWLYENRDLYVYNQDNNWKYKQLPASEVKGQWTQKVYQVDDGPRYEGSATWIHADGKHYWESTADAPLPRREFSKRDDYNVMFRRNRHEITKDGWLHEQDNDKIIRTGEGDELLAQEKGLNTYSKVAEAKCQVAKAWWEKNKTYWTDVRLVWDELFAKKQTLTIRKKVDDKVLFMKLFALEDEVMAAKPYNSEAAKSKIRNTIQAYIESVQNLLSTIE